MLAIAFAAPLAFNPVPGNGQTERVAVGDFNNDGIDDIAVNKNITGPIGILIGAGNGNFGVAPHADTADNGATSLAVADFDADGNDDIATATWQGDFALYKGKGNGTFNPPSVVQATPQNQIASAGQVQVGDFNGDGKPDVALPHPFFDAVIILINNGAGGFAPSKLAPVASFPQDAVVADFNGDGNDDIATTSVFTDSVAVILGDGAGGFSPPIQWGAGLGPNAVTAADFDDDGTMDLAAADADGKTVAVLIGTGTGAFAAAQLYGVAATPQDIVSADIDSDGDADVVIPAAGGKVYVLANDGTGTLAAPAGFPAGTVYGGLAVGHFDGDLRPDLAVARQVDVAVLLNKSGFASTLTWAKWLTRSVLEGTGYATVKVELSAPTRVPASLRYATVDGTATSRGGDYTATSGVLDFRPGETVKEITIPINPDRAPEATEQFYVDFTDPVNLSVRRQRGGVIVADDDTSGTFYFKQRVYKVVEGDLAVGLLSVERRGGAQGLASVDFVTSDITATEGADYTRTIGRLSFGDGQTVGTIAVPILDDLLHEPLETLNVTLRNPIGAALGSVAPAELGIFDNELHISGRQVFYNNSAFDGGNAAPTPADSRAAAPDKVALLPGRGRATFANVTSFSKGINGVMFDAFGVDRSLGPEDLSLSVGTDERSPDWAPAPAPSAVLVQPGAGAGGADRVFVTWPDGSILNEWLRVVIKPTPHTALSFPDMFWFGNLAGAAGELPRTSAFESVGARDYADTRRHFTRAAAIANPFDFNRDGRVDGADVLTVRRGILGRPLRFATAPPAATATTALAGVLGVPFDVLDRDRPAWRPGPRGNRNAALGPSGEAI